MVRSPSFATNFNLLMVSLYILMLLNLSVFPLKIFILLLISFCLFIIHRVRNISPICEKKAIPRATEELSGRSPASAYKVVLSLTFSANKTNKYVLFWVLWKFYNFPSFKLCVHDLNIPIVDIHKRLLYVGSDFFPFYMSYLGIASFEGPTYPRHLWLWFCPRGSCHVCMWHPHGATIPVGLHNFKIGFGVYMIRHAMFPLLVPPKGHAYFQFFTTKQTNKQTNTLMKQKTKCQNKIVACVCQVWCFFTGSF